MENEEYNPVDPIFYKYKGVDFLTSELDNDKMSYDNIYICSYDVNVEGKYPFLRFLLSKPSFNASVSFPQLYLLQNLTSIELIEYAKIYLCGLLMLTDFESFNKATEFKGYFEFNNDLFIFFDVTACILKINDIYKTNNIWLTLVDEIVNYKNVCNIPIDYFVVNFFTANENMCFLVDETDKNYEIPLVCYVNKPENRLNFTFIFGEPKTDKNGLLGPFYYFKDFNTSFKNGGIVNSNNTDTSNEVLLTDYTTKYGIVRFAIFIGNLKFIENDINDNIDESEISIERLQDTTLDQNMERLTHRISDRDGKWAQEYDSAYVGCIELDNGTIIDEHVLAVKEYKQQIPLSYHFVDNKTLHKNTNEYSIM
jgi:hypothetical protein